jgi:VanZ family protein
MPDQAMKPARGVRRLRTRRPPAILVVWLPVVVWAAVIFVLSATPHLRVAQADDLDFIVRKAGHMAAFGILAVLLWRALSFSAVCRAMAWSLLLTIAYAATDEFHQSFTAGRNASPVDVSIDSAGAVIALVALAVWLHSRGHGAGA